VVIIGARSAQLILRQPVLILYCIVHQLVMHEPAIEIGGWEDHGNAAKPIGSPLVSPSAARPPSTVRHDLTNPESRLSHGGPARALLIGESIPVNIHKTGRQGKLKNLP
jgi:hypothetical protein